MKVLMIEPLGFSGICYYTGSLCRSLNKKIDVTLLTSRNYELYNLSQEFTVKAILPGMNRNLPKYIRFLQYSFSPIYIANIISQVKPDLIHWQDTFVPLIDFRSIALITARGIPFVYTAHDVRRGNLLQSSQPGEMIGLKGIYDRARHVIVHSKGAYNELIQDFHFSSEKISILPLGIQDIHTNSIPVPHQREGRIRLKLPEDKIILLFFGNLKLTKGLDLLLEALKIVIDHGYDPYLIVAGSERTENDIDYRDIARNLEIEKHTRFDLGYVPIEHVPDYFAASDLVVLPYKKVYQSAVIQTAYTFGRPVLVTPLDEFKSVVDSGKSGFVTDSIRADAIATSIIFAMDKKEDLLKMGEYAKEMALKRFSWLSIATKTLEIYNKVIL